MSRVATSGNLNRQRSTRHLFIAILAICALTISLSTRTSTPTLSASAAAQSQVSHTMRQHLDTDAAEWAAPALSLVVSEVVSFYPRVSPARPPIPSLFFEESVYNRPPPSC